MMQQRSPLRTLSRGLLLSLFPLVLFQSCQQEKKTESAAQPVPADSISAADTSAAITAKPRLTAAEEDSLLRIQAKELAQKFIIVDGHVDLPYRLQNKKADVSEQTDGGDFDYVRAKAGGLDAPFMSIYIPAHYENNKEAKAFADRLISMIEQLAAKHPGKFALARSPEEIRHNFNAGLISLPMGMENGTPIAGKLENIDYFFQRGIRYITLAHSKNNHISDSSYDPKKRWGGLSPFGKEVVQRMNELGMLVDVSHISDSAFFQVTRISKAPVIASHSSARHFTPGFERNMSDDMIRALANNGGVIMVNFGSSFIAEESLKKQNEAKAVAEKWRKEQGLAEGDPAVDKYKDEYFVKRGGRSTVQAVAGHIDHIAKLVGVEHVGFGSDFDGVGDTLPEGLRDVSDYPNLIYELLKMGYSEEDIQKISSGNVLRVWDEVEKVAEASAGV